MIPAEEWWGVIQAYGTQIWPAQVVFYIIAILLTGWLFFKPGPVPNTLVKLFLAISFGWIGVAFFLTLAKGITGDSYGNCCFGIMFIIVSLLFAIDLFRKRMLFSPPTAGWRWFATLILTLLVFCYPFIGLALGHPWTSLIVPGTFPCPTTALGLVILTTALPLVDKIAYILLLFWAVPFPPLIQIPKYGVYEDTIMFLSGFYSLALLIRYWKAKGPGPDPEQVV